MFGVGIRWNLGNLIFGGFSLSRGGFRVLLILLVWS